MSSAPRKIKLTLDLLEDRTAPAVHFVIDPRQDVRPISPFIYGINPEITVGSANPGLNQAQYANLNLPFERLGGNRLTAYNWENNASNAGSDYLFQNDSFMGGGSTPGGGVAPFLNAAAQQDAAAMITVPILGYVAADTKGDGDVRNSGAGYLTSRFRQTVPRKGSAFSLNPNTTDSKVFADEFVNWVNANYPHGQTDPDRPIFYSLDNEPDLWSSTHNAIHPNAVTYAELVSKTIAFADAIKDTAPNSLVFGPSNYGFNGYVTLQDAPDRAGRDFQAFYLQQLAAAEATYGHRLVDVLDVHWYPEARGDGVRITGTETSAGAVAARLQAPRSLWDATYRETSWIADDYLNGPIDLLDRLQDKIDANYPGTKLGITEYNYGGGQHISGGIAQADVLGVLGREGVYAASQWPLQDSEPFVLGAFRSFRNFDGNDSTFGDTSIRATTDNVAGTSVYASRDTSDPNTLVVVAINKTGSSVNALTQLRDVLPGVRADLYRLTSASSTPQSAGSVTITDPDNFNLTMPAYSVTTIRISLNRLAPGYASRNVGSPLIRGHATFNANVWAVSGGGVGIGATNDSLHMVTKTFTGNGLVSARVTSLAGGSAAKAGVTFRNLTSTNASFAAVFATGTNGVVFQTRASTGAATQTTTVTNVAKPVFVKLVRYGTSVSGYYSTNGSTWVQIGSARTVGLATSVFGGLAVTGQNAGVRAEATFTNFAFNNAPTVATAASASPGTVTGTTTTLRVLGADGAGEAGLRYTWATVGTPPAAVTFTPNGTNAAKQATARFTRSGTYTFRVTITDGAGLTVTSTVTVVVAMSKPGGQDDDSSEPPLSP